MASILELSAGRARLRLAPSLGGRATRCTLVNRRGEAVDLFHPYPEAHTDLEHWAKGGLYPLVPYSGRIAHARLEHGGRIHALETHPDARPHTLHGSAHRQAWQADRSTSAEALLSLEHLPDAHWPWPYRATMAFSLSEHSLSVALWLTASGADPMPAGIGLHPYFPGGPGLELQMAAREAWSATPDHLALAPAPVEPADDDRAFRSLDEGGCTVFLGGWDHVARVRSPMRGVLEVRTGPPLDHVVLHRPEGGAYLCLEPVSHVADAFNLAARGVAGTGARVLAPGDVLEGRVWFGFTGP